MDKEKLRRMAETAIKEQAFLEQNAHIPELVTTPEGIEQHKEAVARKEKHAKISSKCQEVIEVARAMLTMRPDVTPREALDYAEEFVTIGSEYCAEALAEFMEPEDDSAN